VPLPRSPQNGNACIPASLGLIFSAFLVVIFVLIAGCGGESSQPGSNPGTGSGPGSGSGSGSGGASGSLTSSTFATLGGGVLRGFNDTQRGLIFASNLTLNEVDVVSNTDFSVVKRIDLPQPVGLDQMPDGKTIVVGTMTQGIYLVDEDTYAAQSFFISTPSPIGGILLPIIPAAMANGKVLFISLTPGRNPTAYYLEGSLYEWDPTTNSFTAPSSSISSATTPVTVHLARSGDHKFAIFDQYGGGVFLYSSDGDTFININNGLFSGDVAGNADSSQFALSINGAVNFYDRNLNLLSSVSLPTRAGSPTQEVAPYYGMQYSADSSTVYIQATDVLTDVLVVIDAQQFAVKGMIPAYFTNTTTPYLMASGSSQTVYVAATGGVGAVDCSNPANSPTVYSLLPILTPDSVPLNNTASVTFETTNLPQGTTVTVGSKPATLSSSTAGQAVVTVPAFSTAGPADIAFSLPDGSTFVFPQALAYGTTASALNPGLVPDQVSVPVLLSGFGIAPQQQLPSVTVEGGVASLVPNSLFEANNISLQQIQFSTPPSSTAGAVDVAVSSPNGTSTMKSALTYVHTTVVPSDPGLSSVLYDSGRNLLYAVRTNGSQVFVFDPVGLQWKSPLPIPGALSGANYNYFTMSSDGTNILAVDSNNAVLSVFSPDNPSAGQSISLHNASAPNAPPASQLPFLPATSVGVTSGKAFVSITGWYPAVIDLSSMSLTYSAIGVPPGDVVFRNSLGGSQLIAGSVGNSGGGVYIWNPTTGTFQTQGYNEYFDDFAVTNDGKTSAAVSIDQLGTQDFTYFIDNQLHFIGYPEYPDLALPQTRIAPGVQFNPQGTVFVIPRQNAVDFFDVATGHLRASYGTPESTVTPQNVADINTDMTMDSAGQTVFVISASGLTVIQFAQPIDSLPLPAWPFYRRKAGTVVRVPGSRSVLASN
jgi:hypothetical protein